MQKDPLGVLGRLKACKPWRRLRVQMESMSQDPGDREEVTGRTGLGLAGSGVKGRGSEEGAQGSDPETWGKSSGFGGPMLGGDKG